MKIDWESLRKLEAKYGGSFYILDTTQFKSNYLEFLNAFRSIYLNSNIAYSYKTNYTPKLCQLVNAMGGYAEVVSQMEYELARRVGVPAPRIIFNGPFKTAQDLERALLSGSIVNLDSSYEVAIVSEVAGKYPEQEISVGLRCNFDIGTNSISRFGFDVEKGELEYAFRKLNQIDNCEVGGLHYHSSALRSIDSYALRARKILELTAMYFKSCPPRFIDLGGGFFGKMGGALKKQFSCPIPEYQEYAQAIAPQFNEVFSDQNGPELILEPGVAIVGDVMQFVAKVIDTKTIRSRKVALTTGSVHNIKPTMHGKNLPMRVYPPPMNSPREEIAGTVDVVGYTCMEQDCLYREYPGNLARGDYLVFDNVGAYTIVFKPPFIRTSPPIIAYEAGLGYELVKRHQDFENVFEPYIF